MPNPIADPLVDNVVSPDLEGIVGIDAEQDGVVILTINGAGPANALNSEIATALKEAFETLHGADHVRLVVLRGHGGTFSSGFDLQWLGTAASDWSEDDLKDDAMAYAEMLQAVTHIPALTVALVEGEAGDMGVGLVAACDMAVAASDARFGFPAVKSGAIAAMAAPYVVNAIGPRQAKNLFMSGRMIGADYAHQIGLVQQIIDGAAVGEVISRLAEETLQNSGEAMHEAKRLAWDVWARKLDHGLMEETARAYARTRFGGEGREGLNAALEGRRPSWASA